MKGKSHKIFYIIVSTKSVVFKFRFRGFGGAAGWQLRHPRLSDLLNIVVSVFQPHVVIFMTNIISMSE
jgi:hypothetical protein